MLYVVSSGKDNGTIYAARNFLNAKNVPLDPMDNVDAAYEFLEEYTEALILSAYDQVKSNFQNLDNCLPAEQESTMHAILDKMVDDFAIPSVYSDWKIDSAMFMCPECDKSYKRIASLRKHQKEKHGFGEKSNSTNNELECKFCNKEYKRERSYRNHLIKKHPQQSSSELLGQYDSQSSTGLPLQESSGDHSNHDYVYRYIYIWLFSPMSRTSYDEF